METNDFVKTMYFHSYLRSPGVHMSYTRKNKAQLSAVSTAITSDGHKLAYRVWKPTIPSEGVPLVLVQGWMAVKEDWAGLDRAICKRAAIPVVIFDNRGLGESKEVKSGFSMKQFLQDTMSVADTALGESAVFDLLGISMGGCICQLVALSHPNRIRKLILGCTTTGGPEVRPGPGLTNSLKMVTEFDSLKLSFEDLVTHIQKYNLPKKWVEEHPRAFQTFIQDSIQYHRPIAGVTSQGQTLMKFNVSKTASNIEKPTLVIHGDEDEMVPLESGQHLASKIPASQLCVLEGAAHFFWISHQIQSVRAILAFLYPDYLITPTPRSKL